MAKKNLRKLVPWKKKWIAIYIAIMIFFALLLVASIIFLDSSMLKILLVTYEVCIILAGVAMFIISIGKNQKQ